MVKEGAISLLDAEREKREEKRTKCSKLQTAQGRRPRNRPADMTRHYYPHVNGKVGNYSFVYFNLSLLPLYVPWQRELKSSCLKFPKHLNKGSQLHKVPSGSTQVQVNT